MPEKWHRPQGTRSSIRSKYFAGCFAPPFICRLISLSITMAASKAIKFHGDDSQSPARTIALKTSAPHSEANETRQLLHLFERSIVLRDLSDNIESKVVSSALSASIKDDLFTDAFAELHDASAGASINLNDPSDPDIANLSVPAPPPPAVLSRFLQLSFTIIHASELRAVPVPWRPNSLAAKVCNPFATFQCCGQTFSTAAQHVSRNPVWRGSWSLVVPSTCMHDDTPLNISVYSDDSSRGFSNILVGCARVAVSTVIGALGAEKHTWVKLTGAESGELSFQCVCTELQAHA